MGLGSVKWTSYAEPGDRLKMWQQWKGKGERRRERGEERKKRKGKERKGKKRLKK